MRVAVILMHIMQRMRVDHGGTDDVDDTNLSRRSSGHPRRCWVSWRSARYKVGPQGQGGHLGLASPRALGAAARTAAERQDGDLVAQAAVGEHRALAGAYLDVVGVRADREHGLAGGQPRGLALGDQWPTLASNWCGRHRLLQELVGGSRSAVTALSTTRGQ